MSEIGELLGFEFRDTHAGASDAPCAHHSPDPATVVSRLETAVSRCGVWFS